MPKLKRISGGEAIRFHIETFGEDVLDIEPPILEAFVAEAGV